MAAYKAISRCRSFSAFSRYFREATALLSIVQRPTASVIQQRSINTSEQRNKGDKFNLANQSRKKRRFRPDKLQEDMVYNKVKTFKLDPLDDDHDRLRAINNTRQDALSTTLQQAMTSLLESNDVDRELVNYNVEITHVKITKGHVVFYWKTPDEDSNNEEIIENLLQSNERTIRFLLSSYHHLNISPRVVFARDKHLEYLADIETLLNTSTQDSKQDS